MSIIRRHILLPILIWVLVVGAISYGISYGILYYTADLRLSMSAGMSLFVLMTLILLYLKLHVPLQKITREMKALLTGKGYRRIMTSKRNEIGILAHFFNEITRNLESISTDVKSHKRIKEELNAAQRIQKDLLPKNAPDIAGLDVTAKTRPASEIGGDTFDFYPSENKMLMYIGDSTGHGVPAGIVMVMVDTLIETFMDLHDKLSDIMINLNKYLKPHLQTTMFMTMILAEWTPETRNFKWVGAGHEYVIHLSTAKGSIRSIPSGGIAVGMVPDNTALVKEQAITLEENDFVILYTDGINEAKNVMGEIYSLEKLQEFIKTHASPTMTSEELFQHIAIDVGRFMEGAEQKDDMTLIVMKATSQKAATQDETTTWEEEEEEEAATPTVETSAAPQAAASTEPS